MAKTDQIIEDKKPTSEFSFIPVSTCEKSLIPKGKRKRMYEVVHHKPQTRG